MAFSMAVRNAERCASERIGVTMTMRYKTLDVSAALLQSALLVQWPPQL